MGLAINGTKACKQDVKNALNGSRECIERALENTSMTPTAYIESLGSSTCSGPVDLVTKLALEKVSKRLTKDQMGNEVSSHIVDIMMSVDPSMLNENKARAKTLIKLAVLSLWDLVSPHVTFSVATMNKVVLLLFDALIQLYKTKIWLCYISAFAVLAQVIVLCTKLHRLGCNQYSMIQKCLSYRVGMKVPF